MVCTQEGKKNTKLMVFVSVRIDMDDLHTNCNPCASDSHFQVRPTCIFIFYLYLNESLVWNSLSTCADVFLCISRYGQCVRGTINFAERQIMELLYHNG